MCESLSIVNGAQTVRSLHKAHSLAPGALRNVHVLLRVTEFSSKKTVPEQEFLDNVTKYNNTQNAIKLSDFRSNDRVQYDLRKRFEGLPAVGGRKFLYKNKRSGERETDRIAIGMEEFVKTVCAFRLGPDDVFGGTGHVFDSTKGGGYFKLFGDGDDILPWVTGDMFKEYAGIWFVCSEAKEIWRVRSRESKDPALERRWMFYFALGESLRAAYSGQNQDLTQALRALSNPVWIRQDRHGPVKKVIGRHCRVALKALTDAYKGASEKPGFTHRNWFRSESTLNAIRENISGAWTAYLAEHGDEYVLPRPK